MRAQMKDFTGRLLAVGNQVVYATSRAGEGLSGPYRVANFVPGGFVSLQALRPEDTDIRVRPQSLVKVPQPGCDIVTTKGW